MRGFHPLNGRMERKDARPFSGLSCTRPAPSEFLSIAPCSYAVDHRRVSAPSGISGGRVSVFRLADSEARSCQGELKAIKRDPEGSLVARQINKPI